MQLKDYIAILFQDWVISVTGSTHSSDLVPDQQAVKLICQAAM